MSLKTIRAEQKATLRKREVEIKHAVNVMLDLEEKHGWTSVFLVFKRWVNKPKRGKFL